MKKKFRDITVDNIKYTWKVVNPDSGAGISLKIWKDKRLIMLNAMPDIIVTPATVAYIISYYIKNNKYPEENLILDWYNTNFKLKTSKNDMEIPKIMISKNEFIHAMKGIKAQILIDLKNHQALSDIFKNTYMGSIENVLYNTLITLLEQLTIDTESKWIEYFIYELDFGKENYRLQVYDKNNKEIPLSTIEDLWNMLNNK